MVPSPPSDPSERTEEASSECTTSGVVPAGDTLSAVIGGLNIGIAAGASDGDKVRWYTAELGRETAIALGVAQLALFGGAAVYGFTQIARCKDLRKEVERGNPTPASSGTADDVPKDEYVTE